MGKNKRWKIVFLIFFIGAGLIGIELYRSSKVLSPEYFQFQTKKVKKPFRIAVISDLHDQQFGKKNQKLIRLIKKENPDMVLMVGDMLDKDSANAQIPIYLVERLSKLAPVYYALGNHEIDYEKKKGGGYRKELLKAGAHILDRTYEDIMIKGNPVRIGGMFDYAFSLTENEKEYQRSPEYSFLKDFEDTDQLKLYVTHRPEAFFWSVGKGKNNWDLDVVFSGHIHGGQVVLPVLGGIYGAEQGWFPEYVDGKYELNQSTLFVTRGLGSSDQKIPRFFNLPQLMVIDVMPGG